MGPLSVLRDREFLAFSGTAFALVQLLVVLPLGRYVDTHDAKRVVLGGLVVNVVVFGGYFLVDPIADVLLVRVFGGFSASVLWVTGSTGGGETGPDGERGQWLGACDRVGAFSSLAGDVVGGALLTLYGFQKTSPGRSPARFSSAWSGTRPTRSPRSPSLAGATLLVTFAFVRLYGTT